MGKVFGTGDGTTGSTASNGTDGDAEGSSTGSAATSVGTGDGGTASGGTGGIRLDVGPGDTGGGGPGVIPTTCEQAEDAASSVGCVFYAVDLHNARGPGEAFAIAVANVQVDDAVSAVVERRNGTGGWDRVEGPTRIEPLDLAYFAVPEQYIYKTGIGQAYRVTTDAPVSVYQFNPLDGGSHSSDASLLLPINAWDSLGQITGYPGRQSGAQAPYLAVVSGHDGTTVQITPSADTDASTMFQYQGPPIGAGTAGAPMEFALQAGEFLQIAVDTGEPAPNLSGTRVRGLDETPVGVFYGHECTQLPYGRPACDHLEEQLPGLRMWGKHYVAARVPPRLEIEDPTLWEIHASEDGTVVTIDGDGVVPGLPLGDTSLDAGEVLTFEITGTRDAPGDFEVDATAPIMVVNYMTGAEPQDAPIAQTIGDPAMVQMCPVEQFLPRYVVLVPNQWENDHLTVTRRSGARIDVNGQAIPNDLFIPVADGTFEVARIPIYDGVWVLDGGAQGFGVVVSGADNYDSYAYLGGMGTAVINPIPPG